MVYTKSVKVLLEFSRGSLVKHRESIELLRQTILDRGYTLTNDLVEDSRPRADLLPEGIYHRLQAAIAEAQCVIIEGSVVSLSVGFVLTEAINVGKPVLFLMHGDSVTQRNRFISSIESKLLTHKTYQTEQDLIRHLNIFLRHHGQIKTRFNLVLPNELNSYITVESRRRRMSKTEYIIGMLEADRQQTE